VVKSKVLIVEDDTIVGVNTKKILERLGYEVTGLIAYGENVSESIEKNAPDIVLMDIWLKGEMDGIEVTELINGRWDIPVIYITSHTDVPTMMRANKTRHYGYLKKPVGNSDMQMTIKSVLGREDL
jgi:DNA-binding NtrC family response regulator